MTSSSAHGGRRQRFDSLVSVYYPDMFRYAAWLSRDKAIAEDVVQEALLRAWKSLDALRDDNAAKQWLLTIVRRENARYFERRRLETVEPVADRGPQRRQQRPAGRCHPVGRHVSEQGQSAPGAGDRDVQQAHRLERGLLVVEPAQVVRGRFPVGVGAADRGHEQFGAAVLDWALEPIQQFAVRAAGRAT